MSTEKARSTFYDAYADFLDCAIVCVYYAQFEYRYDKNKASRIIKHGKFDGECDLHIIFILFYV